MTRMSFAGVVSVICVVCQLTPAFAQTFLARASSGIATAVADAKANAPKSAPAGTTRIAVINLGYVFNKYERATVLKEELQSEVSALKEDAKKQMENITILQQALQKNEFKNGTREQYEEKLINCRRRFEDIQRTASVKIGKAQQTQLQTLWNDVRAAVKRYAAQHNIELVLTYGEPLEAAQRDAFANIDRKMRAADMGGFVPFLVRPGVDISEAVTEMLNRHYREEQEKSGADDSSGSK